MSDGHSHGEHGSGRGSYLSSNPNRRFMTLSQDGSRWFITRKLVDYVYPGDVDAVANPSFPSSRLCPTDLKWGVRQVADFYAYGLPVWIELESD